MVPSDGNAMFIDFQAIRQISDSGDFERLGALMIPCAECRPVTQVIEQGTAPLPFFVKPTFAFAGGGWAGFDFVGRVPERAAVTVVVMDLL